MKTLIYHKRGAKMMTSQLLINEPPLQVLPTLARNIGLNEAIILQQVHYWLNPQFNKNLFEGRHWVHNTYERWQQQFPFWSARTIRRAIENLEEAGLIASFMNGKLRQFKHYTINYDQVNQLTPPISNTSNKLIDGGNNGEISESQWCYPSDHNDHSIGSKCPDSLANLSSSSGQNDRLKLANLTTSHYRETTLEKNTKENTLPPLTPPSTHFSIASSEEEEEEGKINHSQNSNSNQTSKQPHEEMLEIWNQTVQCKFYLGREAHLTPKRAELLNALMETVFGHQMASWTDYCTLIASSRFLAGENTTKFKVTLDWALVPDNAYKVLEGAIYDKPEPVRNLSTILSWEEFSEELVRILPSNKYLLPWLKISINLAKQIGQVKYRNWFGKVFLSELTDTKAILSVEGSFTKDYISSHFYSEIRCAIHSLRPEVTQIDFQVIQPTVGNH